MLNRLIKEVIFFFLFLYLGTIIIPYIGKILNFWDTFENFMEYNPDAIILVFVPYVIFLIIRFIYLYILKQAFKFPWKQMHSFVTREIFYVISLFILGSIIMPRSAKEFHMLDPETKTIDGILSFDPDIYFLNLLPYFIFLFIRILLEYIRKLWLKVKKRKREAKHENLKRLADYQDMVIITIVLFILSFSIYVSRPKAIYREFYGKSKVCDCIGVKYIVDPTKTFWGKKNKDWGVCFGALYNCK